MTRQDVQNLVDNLKENHPALVDELVPKLMTLGEIEKVLQNLLREGVSIRDLVTIFETLADFAPSTHDPDILTLPDVEPLKGVKICKMGMGDWHEEWQERDHPRGGKYYWIAGYYAPHDEHDEESDSWAYEHGYVAVTPLQLDMTAYGVMESLDFVKVRV